MRAEVSEDLVVAGDKAQHDLFQQLLAGADVRDLVLRNLQKIHRVNHVQEQEAGILSRCPRRAVNDRYLELVGVDVEVVLV